MRILTFSALLLVLPGLAMAQTRTEATQPTFFPQQGQVDLGRSFSDRNDELAPLIDVATVVSPEVTAPVTRPTPRRVVPATTRSLRAAPAQQDRSLFRAPWQTGIYQ